MTDPIDPSGVRSRWRRKRALFSLGFLAFLLILALVAWFARERIADDFIQTQLETFDLPASYDIEEVGAQTQVLTKLVIGDPKSPDFTAKRVEVQLRHRLGLPSVGRVTLFEPRIYGTFRNGVLSFGSLDSVIFRETGEPPRLPEIDLAIRDGRGLVETDYGPLGLKVEGHGLLSDGFEGIIAANAPKLTMPGCGMERATLYGRITTSAGKPRFAGPLRTASLGCEARGLEIKDFVAAIRAETDTELANPSGDARIDVGRIHFGERGLATVSGTVRAGMRGEALTARYTLAARGVETPEMLAAVLTAEGIARSSAGFSRVEIESDVEGNGLRSGASLAASLNTLSTVGEGTLLAPIARQIAAALQRESRASALRADVRLRRTDKGLTLLIPTAEMRGGSGARILGLSRFEMSSPAKGLPRIAGNIVTGGQGLPQISGRMERGGEGDTVFRLTMPPYAAGGSQIAVPTMIIAQGASGAIGFAGKVEASGALPGGSAQRLRLPVSGRWVPGGALSMWRNCTEVGFDSLTLANLTLEKRQVTLCPPTGGAILQSGPSGLRLAAGAPSLDVSGQLGDTPIRLSSGPIGFAWPGVAKASKLAVQLGPPETASHFTISNLDARLGEGITGSFSEADVKLAAVPMDIGNANGTWSYANGVLTLTDASFGLTDRVDPDRFERLMARDAKLALADNIVTAFAELRHPASERVVTTATFHHNVATGVGHTDLNVGDLRFDDQLQPENLSHLALGVIANARGVVTGKGRIDWNAAGVTSSGTFTTEGLDFAAVFGPVKGASGTIEFTDLINLTTAPDQKLRVASINPGVEVVDGEIDFEMKNSQLLALKSGRWPFMGGTLHLREFDFNFGVSEERRYIFEIEGLQAGQFVQQMELENISAAGSFDGTVPIVFDRNGNGRIEEGVLISRPPGGNLSYVGELTYEDLTPIANFAFNALRSLDYSQMRVIMEGPLTGEIVTRVRFDGVSQGEGTKSNFITKRLANLPLQFRINIKAQFYQLMTSMKSLYDPAAVRDPRELGLLSDDGKRLLRREVTGEEAEPEIKPEDLIPDQKPIQQ